MNAEILEANLRQTLPRGRVMETRPAGCPAISLYLFDPSVLEEPLSHDEAQAVVAEPAYWSFCWASGQALAAYVLANPEGMRGRTVVDVGCGSGIVAIAAAMAGAGEVVAFDLDPAALNSAAANAALNSVTLTYRQDWKDLPSDIDVITAADVLYDPENRSLLGQFRRAAPRVLLADSRVRDLGDEHYQLQATTEARTWPDLNEFEEFNRVRIYRVESGDPDRGGKAGKREGQSS